MVSISTGHSGTMTFGGQNVVITGWNIDSRCDGQRMFTRDGDYETFIPGPRRVEITVKMEIYNPESAHAVLRCLHNGENPFAPAGPAADVVVQSPQALPRRDIRLDEKT